PTGDVPSNHCSTDSDCSATARCLNNTCVPRKDGGPLGVDAGCQSNSQCPNGTCVSGVCRPNMAPPGGVCHVDTDCTSGSCLNGICSGAHDRNIGDPCSGNNDCKSG